MTCTERVVTGVGARGYARIPLQPSFVTAPSGGPRIDVASVSGVLRNGKDSVSASASVVGDSAVLEFTNVLVQGDSAAYELELDAKDKNNVLVFHAEQDIHVKPGDNPPIVPTLEYAAPDTSVTSIDISVTSLTLNWAGGDTATSVNKICLSKSPSTATSNTKQTLTVTGKNSANVTVPGVRVGWTSTDTTVFTVDSVGTVRSRCANKSAFLIAKTFLSVVDTITVTVNAPPFSLLMTPDSVDIRRGSTQQYQAIVVDELGNVLPATSVVYTSSDTLRAKVNATTGVATAISNGRALITATTTSTNPIRTTVGVAQVIRPLAAKVVAQPDIALDSLGVSQLRQYFAKALDAANKVIPDASGFAWSSTSASVLSVNATTGLATAASVGSAGVIVSLDGRTDTVSVAVLSEMPPGSIKGKFTDAATGAALSNVRLLRGTDSTFTAGDGTFTIDSLQAGDDIILSKAGYKIDTAFYVPAFPNKTLEVPSSSLSPVGGNGANLTGKVVNALNGQTVSGITVYAYTGINGGPTPKRPNVLPKASATTNASGVYNFSGTNALPAGVYTLLVKGTGYSDGIGGGNSVAGAIYTAKDIIIAPAAVGTGLYIILTWADCPATNVPCDLDAHLTGPKVAPDTVPPRFQVFTGNRRYVVGADTVAALDLDDTDGRGPEIVSLRPSAPVGTFKFYVHNATAGTTPNKALADSASARVDVYQDAKLIGTFFPPAGFSGNVWNVFDYDGARLIPVGTITTESNPGVLALRAASEKKKKQ